MARSFENDAKKTRLTTSLVAVMIIVQDNFDPFASFLSETKITSKMRIVGVKNFSDILVRLVVFLRASYSRTPPFLVSVQYN